MVIGPCVIEKNHLRKLGLLTLATGEFHDVSPGLSGPYPGFVVTKSHFFFFFLAF